MTGHHPDWSQTYITNHLWQPEYEALRLTVAGYLLAVGVCHDQSSPNSITNEDLDARHRGVFFLRTEGDGEHELPLAILNWDWTLNQCGVGFRTPVPDVNSANAHILRRIAPAKTDAILRVTTVHLGMTFA
jgi:hypothetical protein